jgi:hypothetical protein
VLAWPRFYERLNAFGVKLKFKPVWTLPFCFAYFIFCPVWSAELTPAELAYQKILNADAIQQVTYEDVRGIGKKDALVVYSQSSTISNAPIIGGAAVFDHDKGLLWKTEVPCYNYSADVINFDKENPKIPFIRATSCSNASIGCSTYLFRWDGKTFAQVYASYGEDNKLITLADGNPVFQCAWRSRGVPSLWRYEKGEVVDCSKEYPDFYETYIKAAYDALALNKWPDLQPMMVEQNYLMAFIYAGKFQEGLDFFEKLRPLMVEKDQERSNQNPSLVQIHIKGFDNTNLFQSELDKMIVKYKKWNAMSR